MSRFVISLMLNCFLWISFSIHGQEKYSPFKFTYPSANAASLGTFGTYQVGYDGRPGIGIELINVKTSSHNIAMSLSYDASGLKPAQTASWVGLGWALNSHGVISRTIRGMDDFDGQGYYYAASAPPATAANKPYYDEVANGRIDIEPDIFTYNFAGESGKFVFGKKSNNSPAILQTQNNLRIEYVENGSKWVITTPDGYKYFFGTREGTKDEYSYSQTTELPDNAGLGAYRPIIKPSSTTSWYLDSVVSPSNETVNYHYEIKSVSLSQVQKTEKRSILVDVIGSCSAASPRFDGVVKTYSSSRQTMNDIYLSEITFKNGSLKFETEDREDVEYVEGQKPKRLSSIILKDAAGKQKKKFIFTYGYFNAGTSQQRLKLNSVYQVDELNNRIPPYEFKYVAGTLPDKLTKSIDHWGFYNAKPNTTLLPTQLVQDVGEPVFYFAGADRYGTSDVDVLKTGVLESITYPTGGRTDFEYELNQYQNLSEEDRYELKDESVSVLSSELYPNAKSSEPIELTSATPVKFSWGYERIDPNAPGRENIQFNFSFLTKEYPTPPVVRTVTSFGNWNCPLMPDPTCGATSWDITETLDPGNYKILVERLQGHATRMTASWKRLQLVSQRYGGGLRIQSITNHSFNGDAQVRSFTYEINGTTTGRLISKPLYLYQFQVTDTPNQGDCMSYLGTYNGMVSSGYVPGGLHSGSTIVGYDVITEKMGVSGSGGSIEYTYYNQPDDRPTYPFLPVHSSPNNGKLRETRFLDADKHMVKSTEYDYVLKNMQVLEGRKLYQEQLSQLPVGYEIQTYLEYSNWLVPNYVNEISHVGDKKMKVRKHFRYDNSIHKQLTSESVSMSDKTWRVTKYRYPSDYSTAVATSIVKQMATENIISPVIEQQVMQYKGTEHSVIGGTFIKYGSFNGVYAPALAYEQEIAQPLMGADTLMAEITVDASLPVRYRKMLFYDKYDVDGNLISGRTGSGNQLSYLWSKQSGLLASIENATSDEVDYTSFEDTDYGSWILNSAGISNAIATALPPTGTHFFEMNAARSLSRSNLTTGKPMIVSYWSNAGVYSITGVTASNVTQTAGTNGWTLYKHAVVVNQTQIEIKGAGGIDELRLYPASAQMTTYYSDQQVGVAAISDPNGNIQYYSYDTFNRLNGIWDKDRKLQKAYEYQYQIR